MAYIGAKPVSGLFQKQTLTTDGSTTTFSLDLTVASTTAIIVSVGGVIQNPDTAYTLSGGGTSIVFTAAPASTDTTYIHYLGIAVIQTMTDVNGTEFILDADADTSLTADTDDEVDIKVGGTDRSTIKTTGFHNIDSYKFVAGTGDDMQIYHDGSNSYITNATGALKLATETSGIAITIGHSTSEVTVADNMTVAGDLTVTGTASFGDTNITNVGSITLDSIANDGTDGVTIDSSTDVIIDAGGADIILKDDGTEFGRLTNSSTDFIISSSTSDKDIIFKVNDGGSSTEVARFDGDVSAFKIASGKKLMIGAAEEYLSGDGTDISFTVGSGGDINIGSSIGLTFGDDGEKIEGDGTDLTISGNNINLTATADVVIPNNVGIQFGGASEKIEGDGTDLTISANNLTVDAAADIILDAAGNNVTIKSGGTSILDFVNSSSDAVITASVQDKDIIFKGDDNGSAITALTLDMSEAGAATFNDKIVATELDISGNVDVDGTLETDALTIDGVTLAETIADTVGAMVGSNTETGISVTYEDGDNTLDFALGAAQTTITSLLATDIKIGEDDQTKIDFETADTIHFYAGNQNQLKIVDGGLVPITDNDVDLGTGSLEFKDLYVDGTAYLDSIGFGSTSMALPSSDGSANQILVTNGSGTLSFADNSGISMGKAIAAAIVFG